MGLVKWFVQQSIKGKEKQHQKKKGDKFSLKEVSSAKLRWSGQRVVAAPTQARSSFRGIPRRLGSEEMRYTHLRISTTFSYLWFEYLSSVHIY